MSLPEKSPKLKATIKSIHSNFQSGINALVLEAQEFKDKIDSMFLDFTHQCIEVEDRLKDVLKEKKTILTEYEILLRKEKEGCQKCSQLEVKLNKESKKLKQYEMKMKNIANLLYVNTMNTEANLMSHVNAKQSQYSQPVKVTNTVVSTNQETSESQKELDSIDVKIENDQGSKILVHEQDDEIYFETTLKRKTPEFADTVMEIPETICEDFTYFESAKRPQYKDDAAQHQTPSKKRKFSQCSPKANRSQQSPRTMRSENQSNQPASPLRTRNTLVATRERNLVDASPSLITKPKLRSRIGTEEKDSAQESLSARPKKNLSRDDNQEKEHSHKMSVEYELDSNEEMKEESKENSPCDETRFPLFEAQIEVQEASRSGETKTNSSECKASTSQANNRKLNGSKIWENIEFSDDSDDFVDTNERRVGSQKRNTSFSFAKPAAADTSKNKWNLKIVNSSINKSKMKQTKLSLEKRVSKIDITQVEGYNGGAMPSNNTAQAKDTRVEHNKFVIEETQELEDDADDEEEVADTRQRGSQNKKNKQVTSSPDSHSDSGGSIRVRSFAQLTLPEDSMFMPNAVSTQKSNNQNQNKNSNKSKLSTQQVCKSKINSTSSPKKACSPSNKNKSPRKTNSTPKSGFKKPSVSSNSKLGVTCSSTASDGTGMRKALFLPKETKHGVDYTSQWTCPDCIDYFLDGYGEGILKVRPPPKKCGHNNKYPATPPDFWDPMCS